MQNLDAYQAIELQKQLAKMQMINSFQGYIQKALSLSMAQQAILQPGMTYPQFNGLCPNNRASLMQPAYFDPNTLFGPSLTMLNTNTPQIEPRMVNQSATMNISAQNDLPLFKFQTMPLQSPQVKPQQPMQSTQLLELPPLPIKKKCEPADDGFEDLTDFFGKKASNASTKSSWSAREDDEFDTGKKITLEKEIYIKNPGLPTQKARKRTKVICGHPWKNHHAKGLCKNCYETFGKTRKPWKCDHQAHFAKGYCKKCYLKLRQKIAVKDVLPTAVEEMKKLKAKQSDTETDSSHKIDIELTPNNVKEEAI